MRGLIFAAALLGASTAATGEPARAAPAPRAAADVSELVVTPKARCLPARRDDAAPAPVIVSTFPARDAVVRPGRLVLRVTFDRPMTCSGFFLENPPRPNPCPARRQAMVLSFDRKTVRLICATAPGGAYSVQVGEVIQPFVSLEGRAALPYDLSFTTSSGPAVATVAEALAQDR